MLDIYGITHLDFRKCLKSNEDKESVNKNHPSTEGCFSLLRFNEMEVIEHNLETGFAP